MPDVLYKVDLPAFTGRNVPIKEIASAIGKAGITTRNTQIRFSDKSRKFKRI